MLIQIFVSLCHLKIDFGLFNDLVENIETISLVDWSLSTVIALKELETALLRMVFNIFEFISALVKINDNIVARLSAIIPDLAIHKF